MEIEHVTKSLSLTQKSQFNLVELYKTLKHWFEINGYSFFEREYEDILKSGKKEVMIKWEGSKNIDDYSKFYIFVKFNVKNYEIFDTPKEKIIDGSLKLSFASDILTDYEYKWEHKPIWKFLRGVSDKFFTERKRKFYEKNLKEDTYDLFNKSKSFLNLYKFR